MSEMVNSERQSFCKQSAASLTLSVLSLLFLLGAASQVHGQVPEDSVRNALVEGSWSLQFQIVQNFGLRSFEGSTLSAKKHFTRHKAMRLGVTLLGNTSDREITEETTQEINNDPNQSLGTSEDDDTISNTASLIFSAYYLHYTQPEKEVNFFVGGGPEVAFTPLHARRTRVVQRDELLQQANTVTDRDFWSIGAHLLVGVEWFVNEHISFLGEYGSSFTYSKSNESVTTTTSRIDESSTDVLMTSTTKRFNFAPTAVLFGLSVYF